jgi:hypothetical protein
MSTPICTFANPLPSDGNPWNAFTFTYTSIDEKPIVISIQADAMIGSQSFFTLLANHQTWGGTFNICLGGVVISRAK